MIIWSVFCVQRMQNDFINVKGEKIMQVVFSLEALLAIIAGILILVKPEVLNYVVAGYLILVGILGMVAIA